MPPNTQTNICIYLDFLVNYDLKKKNQRAQTFLYKIFKFRIVTIEI